MAGFRRVALVVAALSVGCGTEGGDTRDRLASEAEVGAAQAVIDEYKRIPTFVPPGPPFDAAGAARGKTVFEIPITSEVPFITAVEEGMRQAAEAVGAKLVVYPNQGDPSQWAQGIRTAIAQKADAITLFAQNPALLGPQI